MAWRIVGSVKHHIEVTAAEHFKEVGLPMKQYVISREDFLRLMDELWELGAVTEEMMEERHAACGFALTTSHGDLHIVGWPYPKRAKAPT